MIVGYKRWITKRSKKCEVARLWLEALELGDDMIRTERLGEVLFPKDVINKINQLRLKHVFFVPESEYWSLPLQWLWSKTGSKASLVAAPTVQSLSLDYQPVQPNRVKYDYVGVGDPDYSAKDIMPTTNVASIPGVAFRSASYAADLTQLNQLPYTNEEIRESSANFEGEKLLLLKSRASEKTLDQYDWGSSKFIHFAAHALVSGEMKGIDEPAIALSAADQNSGNDGLLTASEIGAQNFTDSFVLLSGCRTVSDFGSPVDRGLSGLSLAFLGAGAKHVMVTQWQIPDKTSTDVIKHLIKNPDFENNAPRALASTFDYYAKSDLDPYFWSSYLIVSYPARFNSAPTEVDALTIDPDPGYRALVGSVGTDLLALSFEPLELSKSSKKPWHTKFFRVLQSGQIKNEQLQLDGRWEFVPKSENLLVKVADGLGRYTAVLGEIDKKTMKHREIVDFADLLLKPSEMLFQGSNIYRHGDTFATIIQSYDPNEEVALTRLVISGLDGTIEDVIDISKIVSQPTESDVNFSSNLFSIWGGGDETLRVSQIKVGEVETYFDGRARTITASGAIDNAKTELYTLDLKSRKFYQTGTVENMIVLGAVNIDGLDAPVVGDTNLNEIAIFSNDEFIKVAESDELYMTRFFGEKGLMTFANQIPVTEAEKYSQIPGPFGSISERVSELKNKKNSGSSLSQDQSVNDHDHEATYTYLTTLISLDPRKKNPELIWKSKKLKYVEDVMVRDDETYVLFSKNNSFILQKMGQLD